MVWLRLLQTYVVWLNTNNATSQLTEWWTCLDFYLTCTSHQTFISHPRAILTDVTGDPGDNFWQPPKDGVCQKMILCWLKLYIPPAQTCKAAGAPFTTVLVSRSRPECHICLTFCEFGFGFRNKIALLSACAFLTCTGSENVPETTKLLLRIPDRLLNLDIHISHNVSLAS